MENAWGLVAAIALAAYPWQQEHGTMKVELDMFSGRPNPTWNLTREETATLAAMLQQLPPAPAPAGEPRLGYRGFLLSNPERVGGLPTRIRIGGGIVILEDEMEFHFDTHRAEHWLLRQASDHGFGALVKNLIPQK